MTEHKPHMTKDHNTSLQYLYESNLPGSHLDKLKDLYETTTKLKKDPSSLKFKRITTK